MATRKSGTSKSRGKRNAKAESNGAAETVSAPVVGAADAENSNGATKPLATADQIRLRAYEIFLARGGAHGDDWNDWFAAEQELKST